MAQQDTVRGDRRRGDRRGRGVRPGARRTAGFAARSGRAGRSGRQFRQCGAYRRGAGAAAALAELLFGFYRELFRFGGALDLPPRQALRMAPWIGRFAAAAFRRTENTRHLAPLVRPSAASLGALGQKPSAGRSCSSVTGTTRFRSARKPRRICRPTRKKWHRIGVKTRPMAAEQLAAAAARAPIRRPAPGCGSRTRPTSSILWRRCARWRPRRGNAVRTFERLDVKGLAPRGDKIEILSDAAPLLVEARWCAAACAPRPLLAPFGLRAPLQAVRGYHVEMPRPDHILRCARRCTSMTG